MISFQKLLIFYLIFADSSDFRFLLNFPVIGNSKNPLYKKNFSLQKYSIGYKGENCSKKTFFPYYAKISKLINRNRHGKHSKLERNLNKF